jgi:hypothetical protein
LERLKPLKSLERFESDAQRFFLQYFETGPQNRAQKIIDVGLAGIEFQYRNTALDAEINALHAGQSRQDIPEDREVFGLQVRNGDNRCFGLHETLLSSLAKVLCEGKSTLDVKSFGVIW